MFSNILIMSMIQNTEKTSVKNQKIKRPRLNTNMEEINDQFITKWIDDKQLELVTISEGKFYLTKVREDIDFSIIEISRGEFLQWISIEL